MDLQYQVVYSKRKTLGITVARDCSITVRAPFGLDKEKIRALLESKKSWLYEKTHHLQKNSDKHQLLKKELVSGESMPYLGKHYRLQVLNADVEQIVFKQKFVICKTNQTQMDSLFKNWYFDKAKQKITQRVTIYAKKLGLQYNAVKITNAKRHWGACTAKRNLIFNWKLIKAPLSVIDYIVVHELAHLIEANHSSHFWRIVKTNYPDYQKAKDWLKQNGEFL
jgi:predicted metal-dependent hydrolase